ncbi:Pex13 protein [Xylariales sp. AK1849]|nr:Pex13 protein [Xylariales sp. AK1849]
MASPPKPWERAGATSTTSTMATPSATAPGMSIPTTSTALTSQASGAIGTTPAIPPRPDSLASTVNQNANAYSRFGNTGYNSSPYSQIGGIGSRMYGGYGGYGGGYGGYGGYGGMSSMGSMGGMGGMGGMYGGMYGGMPGLSPNDPNNPNSLTASFGNSTQTTFQMLEGIVGAFGGFAQMLESTYMATHSSFFAMVSVAEQFGNLRETLGSVLGIFTLMRWIRTLIAKLTGRPPPADATALTPAAFARFEGRQSPSGAPGQPKPSRKPLVFFLLAAFGLPYVMSKMIRSIATSQQEEERKRMEASAPLDPSQLEFCRVLYDFAPEGNTQGTDLTVKKGDFIAVLGKTDPNGVPSEWWRCRARDGRVGWLPSTFLEVAKRTGQPLAAIKATASEPATTRTNSMTSATASVLPVVTSKPGDVSIDSFQKSQFYS